MRSSVSRGLGITGKHEGDTQIVGVWGIVKAGMDGAEMGGNRLPLCEIDWLFVWEKKEASTHLR